MRSSQVESHSRWSNGRACPICLINAVSIGPVILTGSCYTQLRLQRLSSRGAVDDWHFPLFQPYRRNWKLFPRHRDFIKRPTAHPPFVGFHRSTTS